LKRGHDPSNVIRPNQRFAARVVAALDERDLGDFDRIARKLFAAFDGQTGKGGPPPSVLALRSGLLPRRRARRATRKTSKESIE
jgi:hypothetical protein